MKALLVLFLFSFSFSSFGLEVMSYNVENLFDTKHDSNKNDWQYLPTTFKGKKENCSKISYKRYRDYCFRTNWTSESLKIKLHQIKSVLTRTRKNLPDILALSEIENENVVSQLAKTLGYKKFIVSDSPDKRGIDLALLYKTNTGLKFVQSKEHVLVGEYFKKKPSRNILEVEFSYKGSKLTIFVNHWPSLSNPTEVRLIAARALRSRIDQLLAKNKKHMIIALGDFNTIPSNYPHPFDSVLLKDEVLVDLHTEFKKNRKISRKLKNKQPLGSYFYGRNMAWNMLDRIFVSKNLLNNKGIDVDLKTFEIFAPEFIKTDYKYKKGVLNGSLVKGTPKRYNHAATTAGEAGFSDHFPLIIKLK